ncbi:H/ACA ribonucleoprotein complex subunit 2-like protein, partial [Stegodyphus mimosarum]
MGKSKKSSVENDVEESMEISTTEETPRLSYEDQLNYVSVIASPMAPKKLAKKLYKLIKKASEHKTYLRHGLKEVQSCIRKGETGLAVFAGDVTPIEVMCHMPAVCEEKNIPYVFTPSRDDLGLAMGVKRSCLMLLIKEHPEYKELYDDCK